MAKQEVGMSIFRKWRTCRDNKQHQDGVIFMMQSIKRSLDELNKNVKNTNKILESAHEVRIVNESDY